MSDENTTLPEDHAAPPEDDGQLPPPVARGRRSGGSSARGIWIMGFALIAGVILLVYSYVTAHSHRALPGTARVATTQAPAEANPAAPTNAPNAHYRDLVQADNKNKVDEAAKMPGAAVVVPTLMGGGEEAPTKVTVSAAPPMRQSSYAHDNTQAAQRMMKVMQDLEKRWNTLPAQDVVNGSAPALMEANLSQQDQRNAQIHDSGPPPPQMPVLQVIPAVVEVGANSDYPGQIIVRLTDPAFDDAKLLGQVEGGGGNNGVGDRVQMRFSKLLWRGRYFSVDALGVDPATRIPAIKGDINYHVVYNVLTNASATFLLGYAAAAKSGFTGGLVYDPNLSGIGLGGGYAAPVSAADVVKGQAAQTWGQTLSHTTFRNPTVTLPLGSALGVVLTAPVRNASSDDLSRPAVATAMQTAGGAQAYHQAQVNNNAPAARVPVPDNAPIMVTTRPQ